jgi:hypothetical protein
VFIRFFSVHSPNPNDSRSVVYWETSISQTMTMNDTNKKDTKRKTMKFFSSKKLAMRMHTPGHSNSSSHMASTSRRCYKKVLTWIFHLTVLPQGVSIEPDKDMKRSMEQGPSMKQWRRSGLRVGHISNIVKV